MQDITPLLGERVKSIESYGAGGFTISGEKVEGSICIRLEKYSQIDAKTLEEVNIDNLELIEDVEILLVGYGEKSDFFSNSQEKALKAKGIKVEYMNSGAASRTYNVLITEERNVAAIIIAV